MSLRWFVIGYLALIFIVPIGILGVNASQISGAIWYRTILDPQFLHALGLTIQTSAIAAGINLIFGTLIAWLLNRPTYPGKTIVTLLIDLPFALPTAVTGIAIATAFSPHSLLATALAPIGIHVANGQIGIVFALTFVGIPFVVRHVGAVLDEMDSESETAARLLGASKFQIATRIILPTILPAGLTGFTAAFARGLGEYGSIIFISGNLRSKTEVISVLIVNNLEEFNDHQATIIAVVMTAIAIVLIGLSHWGRNWHMRRLGLAE